MAGKHATSCAATSNWFTNWEQQLPKPEELIPLSQTLITHDLAIAFNIGTSNNPPSDHYQHHHQPLSSQHNSGEFESSDLAGDHEPARTLKRPRLVWTPQLHKRFVDAVAHLGIKNAVPKTIMQLMNIDGLTRENVASHLQKYRLYLKRVQGLNSGNGGIGSGGDPVTDHLFASSPVPPHFLQQSYNNSDSFLQYMPVAAFQQQQQMVGNHVHRHIGPAHLSRKPNQYVDDLESANGKRALTLFPAGDD